MIARVLTIARKYVGMREATGKNDGKPAWHFSEGIREPWCANFAKTVLMEAGIRLPGNWRYLAATRYMFHELRVYLPLLKRKKVKPMPGDLVFFHGRRARYGVKHVAIVSSVHKNVVKVIEGNFTNTVTWTKRGYSLKTGYLIRGRHNRRVYGYIRWVQMRQMFQVSPKALRRWNTLRQRFLTYRKRRRQLFRSFRRKENQIKRRYRSLARLMRKAATWHLRATGDKMRRARLKKWRKYRTHLASLRNIYLIRRRGINTCRYEIQAQCTKKQRRRCRKSRWRRRRKLRHLKKFYKRRMRANKRRYKRMKKRIARSQRSTLRKLKRFHKRHIYSVMRERKQEIQKLWHTYREQRRLQRLRFDQSFRLLSQLQHDLALRYEQERLLD